MLSWRSSIDLKLFTKLAFFSPLTWTRLSLSEMVFLLQHYWRNAKNYFFNVWILFWACSRVLKEIFTGKIHFGAVWYHIDYNKDLLPVCMYRFRIFPENLIFFHIYLNWLNVHYVLCRKYRRFTISSCADFYN